MSKLRVEDQGAALNVAIAKRTGIDSATKSLLENNTVMVDFCTLEGSQLTEGAIGSQESLLHAF